MHQATLAVLPFDNLSGGHEPDYFSRGFVDDLVADLSRFSDLVVQAPSTHLEARAESADFVLQGSLRRANARLRISTQLVRRDSGTVVWAGKFDEPAEELFDIQDTITGQVVAAVSSRINARLLAASRRKPPTELEAYDLWLQGLDRLRQGTVEADEHARELFSSALKRDPSFARAELGLSLSYFNEWSCQLWHAWDRNETFAFDHASRAAMLDPEDHYAQMVLGRILLFRREFARAEEHFERSLALNRNDADCLVQIGMSMAYLGRASDGNALFARAQRLNPEHQPWYYAYGGVILFALEQYESGLGYARKLPKSIMVDMPAYMAAAYYHTGQPELAREHVDLYLAQFERKIAADRQAEPGEALRWLQHVNPWRYPHDEARLVQAVQAAGSLSSEPPAPLSTTADRNAFRRVGSLWQLSYAGRDVWLPHLKGFVDIHQLLQRAGERVHCLELMGSVDASTDAPTIDDSAKRAYRERSAWLEAELQEAEEHNDLARADKVRTELAQLRSHLSAALGLGGKARKLAAPSERARSAVTQRVRAAVKKVQEAHQALGDHLLETIVTGTYCTYEPPRNVTWHL